MTTPFGSRAVSYSIDPTTGNPIPSINQTLNPQLSQNTEALQGVVGTPFNPQLPATSINPGQTAQDAIMSRLQPQIDRENSQLTTQLANQGITQGSEAWKNAMTQQGQAHNDLLAQAASQGIGVGQQARQQALQEQTAMRELPLNEVSALLSGSQIANPQFSGAGVTAAPVSGATAQQGQFASNVYNQQVAQDNSTMSGLYGLGGSALMGYGMYAAM